MYVYMYIYVMTFLRMWTYLPCAATGIGFRASPGARLQQLARDPRYLGLVRAPAARHQVRQRPALGQLLRARRRPPLASLMLFNPSPSQDIRL